MHLSFKWLFLFLLLFSCQREIEFSTELQERKLVANSFFFPDSSIRIFLNYSRSFNELQMDIFKDLTLNIIDGDGILYDVRCDSSYYYSSIGLIPKAGCAYTISANLLGFDEVFATDTIPGEISIPVNLSKKDSVYFDVDLGYYLSSITFAINDNYSNKDYYELWLMTVDTMFGYINKQIVQPTSHDYDILNENSAEIYTQSVLFSDSLFNGKTRSFSFYFVPPMISDLESGTKRIFREYLLIIHFRQVSKNYYYYKKSLIKHLSNQEGDYWTGTGMPLDVYSNVANGYGIFASYQYHNDTIFPLK